MKIIFLLLPIIALANNSFKGEVNFELRQFKDDNNSYTTDYGSAIAPRIEAYFEKKKWISKLKLSSRTDYSDHDRDILIPEDIYTGYDGERWLIIGGFQTLNWSSTEAFHPADVINPRNFDSNLENADKIGELMLQTTYYLNNGSLNFYLLPHIQDPNLPKSENRLSFFSPGQKINDPIHLDKDGKQMNDKWNLGWATRVEHSFDGIDFSLYAIKHQDRYNPIVTTATNGSIQLYTLPIFQYGLTYQQAIDAFVFKLETASIDYDNSGDFVALGFEKLDHHQIAFGLDYGFSHKNGSDSTFIFEGMSIPNVSKENRANLSIFQRDALIGYRFALNDVLSKELFISFIFDMERSHEYLFSTTYSQRITDTWSLKTGFRYIDAPQKSLVKIGLEPLHQDNQVNLTLTKYF